MQMLADFRQRLFSLEQREASQALGVVSQNDFAVSNFLNVFVTQKGILREEEAFLDHETRNADGVDLSKLLALVRADHHSRSQLFRIKHRVLHRGCRADW